MVARTALAGFAFAHLSMRNIASRPHAHGASRQRGGTDVENVDRAAWDHGGQQQCETQGGSVDSDATSRGRTGTVVAAAGLAGTPSDRSCRPFIVISTDAQTA
jgi:hypothetical protein